MTKFRRNYVRAMTILVTGLMSSNPTIAAGGQSVPDTVKVHSRNRLRMAVLLNAEGSRGEKTYS